jgi:transposase
MIGSTRSLRVFAYTAPADMRKGFGGLYGLVAGHLKRDPLSGELFLFVSGDRKRAKVLLWDGTGLCLYAKRLEKGRFARVWGESATELTVAELDLFLEGSQLVGEVRVSPAKLCLRCLTEVAETATIPHAESGGHSRPRDPPPGRHPS